MADDLEEYYKAVIGPRGRGYYLRQFARFDSGGKAAISWHWPAFFLAPCWFAYRKMWPQVILYFLLPYLILVPLFVIHQIDTGYLICFALMLLVPPVFANALYFRRCRKLVSAIAATSTDRQEQVRVLGRKGGTSRVAAALVLGFAAYYFVPDMVTTIAVPAYQEHTLQLRRSDAASAGSSAQSVQTGIAYRDCPECPEMVAIAAGSFDMGTDNPGAAEKLARIKAKRKTSTKDVYEVLRLTQNENAKPLHRVAIAKPFSIGKTEVTQRQWCAIMGKCDFAKDAEACPVEVSWDDAQEFIQKLNDKTGKLYRLPSEAEWEYACQAGRRQNFCGGDTADTIAWVPDNSGDAPHRVATKNANAWGLYDMSGNVLEWVEDRWHEDYGGAPTDGSAWDGGAEFSLRRGSLWHGLEMYRREVENRVLRGGSYRNIDGYREKNYPWTKVGGFRLARTLP